MADSIQNRRTQQNYLRQVQEEKSQKKRDLMNQKQQDLQALRQYYNDESKKIDSESSDAINHIKSVQQESLNQQRAEHQQQLEEKKQAELEQRQMLAQTNGRINQQSVTQNKTNVYNRLGQNSLKQASNEAATAESKATTKNNDDFYKVQNRGSRLMERENHYVIDAYAPANEKDSIKLSIERNKAVVSGERKYGGQAEDEQKKIETHNFQTFREEFKFDRPVSQEGLTRERIGDFVRFTIPKLESVKSEELS